MDRQHLVSGSDAEIGLHILSKTANSDNEIDQFLRELPSLFVWDWVRPWARSWSYSGFGRVVLKSEYGTYSESVVTYVECEHGVKARLEHDIWTRSTEYGFIASAPIVPTISQLDFVLPNYQGCALSIVFNVM